MDHNEERFEYNDSHLDILIGGQWGSEGKGEIAAFLARVNDYDLAVRVGGPNAGHTYHETPGDNSKVVLQSLPVACAVRPGHTIGIIGAGAVFEPGLLIEEIGETRERTSIEPTVYVDRNATIITEEHQRQEFILAKTISSTGEGVGAATAATVMRDSSVIANHPLNLKALESHQDLAELENLYFEQNTPATINKCLSGGVGMRVMLEGTQGWALGLHTSGYYPYCTSREVTPWALAADTGTNLNLADHTRIIMVLRTYPIRVGGPSGPLPHEISWDELKKKTNGYIKEPEITTVTKKPRRIAQMDIPLIMKLISIS